MSATMVLYLISLITNLDVLLAFIFGISFSYFTIGLLVTAMNRGANCNDKESIETQNIWIINPFKKYYWIFILTLGLACLIPSEKTMYLMVGAKYLQNSQIPEKVSAIINKKLDSYLQEDKDKTNEK